MKESHPTHIELIMCILLLRCDFLDYFLGTIFRKFQMMFHFLLDSFFSHCSSITIFRYFQMMFCFLLDSFFSHCSSMTCKIVTCKSAASWQIIHITSQKGIKMSFIERATMLVLQIFNLCWVHLLSTGINTNFHFIFEIFFYVGILPRFYLICLWFMCIFHLFF